MGLWLAYALATLCATVVVPWTASASEAQAAQQPRGDLMVLVQARAAIGRGSYAEAEGLLKSAAARAPSGDAALELGLLLQTVGRRAEAASVLDAVLDGLAGEKPDAAAYARFGRAARALGEFTPANDAYRRAAALSPGNPAIETAWGELFLDAHQNGDAAQSFRTALKADPKSVPARLGLAVALQDENPPEALNLAGQALALDPSSVGARLLLAELELERGNGAEARAHVDAALAVNAFSPEAHAMAGGMAWLEGRREEYQAHVAAALKVNPKYGEAYRKVGDLAARNYRFDDAAALARQAIKIDPDQARARADLGMHLMRLGDEAAARRELERAFGLDPYDTITFNLLGLLDTLDRFQSVREGAVLVRMDPEEAPVLREYAGALANRALADMSARYEITLRTPVLVEIFPKHDDFAVRIQGLGGLTGALGACFGRVVTLDSPRARPPGDFNWQETLWHELAHVVSLQLSQQRVPRWLTEGISMYEQQRASPSWGREMEVPFAEARRRGRAISVRDLNAGFMNPETIALAYYEASLLVDHIVSTYGQDRLRQLLLAYALGLEGEEAIRGGLAVGTDALQSGFDRMLDGRFAALQKALEPPPGLANAGLDQIQRIAAANPGSYPAQMAAGVALWKAGRADEALQALGRAAALVPMAGGEGGPHVLMAQIALQQGDRTRAAAELEAVLARGAAELDAARQLAELLQGGDPARLGAAYERVVAVDPFDAGAHSALGRLALARQDHGAAVREFRAAIAAGASDPAVAHCDLAEAYVASGDRVQAKRQVLAAMEVAPSYPRAQDLLLKLVEEP